MKLSMQTKDGRLHISVDEPRLDAAVATAFKDKVRDMLSRTKHPVTLDLGQVQFMDSSGLGAVIAIFKTLPKTRALEICGITANVERVFRLTRMDGVLPLRMPTPPSDQTMPGKQP